MEATRQFELVIISAENLKFHTTAFSKHNTFVIASLDSRPIGKTRLTDRGGSSPSWNQTFKLSLVPSARLLQVEVHCKTAFGDKMIGKAEIPVSDFTGDLAPESYLHFLSYRLRDKDGGKNGIINLSVRIDGQGPVCGPVMCQIPAARLEGAGFSELPEFFCPPLLNQIPTGEMGRCMMDTVAVGVPVTHGFPV